VGPGFDNATRQPYLMLLAKPQDHVWGTAASPIQPLLTLYVFTLVPESVGVTPQGTQHSSDAQEHQMKSAEEHTKQLWEIQVPRANLPDYCSRVSQGVPSPDHGAPPLSIEIMDFDVP
jgi:hypothetical protein